MQRMQSGRCNECSREDATNAIGKMAPLAKCAGCATYLFAERHFWGCFPSGWSACGVLELGGAVICFGASPPGPLLLRGAAPPGPRGGAQCLSGLFLGLGQACWIWCAHAGGGVWGQGWRVLVEARTNCRTPGDRPISCATRAGRRSLRPTLRGRDRPRLRRCAWPPAGQSPRLVRGRIDPRGSVAPRPGAPRPGRRIGA